MFDFDNIDKLIWKLCVFLSVQYSEWKKQH